MKKEKEKTKEEKEKEIAEFIAARMKPMEEAIKKAEEAYWLNYMLHYGSHPVPDTGHEWDA